MVVAAYHLAGELGAPLAIMWGTGPDPDAAGFLAVAEPRNRQQRFDALERFGTAMDAYLAPYQRLQTVPGSPAGPSSGPSRSAPTRRSSSSRTRRPRRGCSTSSDGSPATSPPTATTRSRDGPQNRPESDVLRPAAPDAGELRRARRDGRPHHSLHDGPARRETENLAAVWGGSIPTRASTAPRRRPAPSSTGRPPGRSPDPNWDAPAAAGPHRRAPQRRRRPRPPARRRRARRRGARAAPAAWLDTWRALDQSGTCLRPRTSRTAGTATVVAGPDTSTGWRRAPHGSAASPTRCRPPAPSTAPKSSQTSSPRRWPSTTPRSWPTRSPEATRSRDRRPGRPEARGVNGNGPRRRPAASRRRRDLPSDRPAGTALHLAAEPTVRAELASVGHAPDGRQRLTFRVVAGALTTATRGKLPLLGDRVVLSQFGSGAYFPGLCPTRSPWTHRLPEPAGADA
jgi:hypothetical protein